MEPGRCKSWTLDSGLDHGLDYGLEYGLNSRLTFKLLAMVASQDGTRSNVGARNNTGEPTAAAGRPPRQLSITKCLNFKHLVIFKQVALELLHRITLADIELRLFSGG